LVKLTARVWPALGGTSLKMNIWSPELLLSDDSTSAAASLAAIVIVWESEGLVGLFVAPVRVACNPVSRSDSAGSTRCPDISMRPRSISSFSV